MVRFGDFGDESGPEFPIKTIKIAPVQAKFADDLTLASALKGRKQVGS